MPVKGQLEGTYTGTGAPPIVSVLLRAEGTATHLGRFTEESPHEVNFADLTGTGSATFNAANGDTLTTKVTGQATPTDTPGAFFIVEIHEITGGTGRFAGSTGTFIVTRSTAPLSPNTGTTTGSFEGTIVFGAAITS